jgi:hypothetical protein
MYNENPQMESQVYLYERHVAQWLIRGSESCNELRTRLTLEEIVNH